MKKTALLIGNANYSESVLSNPGHDALDLADMLERLGFEKQVVLDGKIKDMHQALKEFSSDLSRYEVALFFFAGHAMQIDGCNYLTAIDTDFDTEPEAKYSSLNLDIVIETLGQEKSNTNILILDACRDNPYERRLRGGANKGLAPVSTPKGTIVAFATSPGQTASDGVGRNGAFTEALLRHLQTQNISIESLFKRVRNTLSVATSGKQVSWEHTSLMCDFCFNPSIANSERISVYSEDALADRLYVPDVSKPVGFSIQELSSRNWYKQNPAVSAIDWTALDNEDRNALFVLGKNLYQAACGKSRNAELILEGLPQTLNAAGIIAKQHVVDGMLYEVFFDSQGKLRDLPKSERFENVFRLEEDPAFKPCFDFLSTALNPYGDRIFYMPGSKSSISVNAPTVDHRTGRKMIYELIFEQTNILLQHSGKENFTPDQEDYMTLRTVAEIKKEISERMVAPSRRLTLIVNGITDDDTKVFFPMIYSLQRVSK